MVREKIAKLTDGKTVPPEVQAKIDAMLSEKVMTLDLIGFKYGTDKASLRRYKEDLIIAHDYLRHYDFLLDRFRNEPIALVELGCGGGASLRMWEEYFPKAEIYGVDLNEAAKKFERGRVHVVIGNATTVETRDEIMKQLGGKQPFIIIDDASHAWSDQRISLEVLWQSLAPGGFYIVEDLQCKSVGSFPQYPPAVLDTQPFFDYVLDLSRDLRWPAEYGTKFLGQWSVTGLPQVAKDIKVSLDDCFILTGAIALKKKM